jgi:hypothetical protein
MRFSMKRSTLFKALSAVTVVGALGLTTLVSSVAHAQYPYPPDEYVAAYEPVYYGGHAAYWYGNRWYYRDGGAWRWYDREPADLAYRRAHYGWAPRGYYGRPGYYHGGGYYHRR